MMDVSSNDEFNFAESAERKEALSPFSMSGSHDSASDLSSEIVDQIHRITTDASRLSEKWYEGLIAKGHTPERYVEALGVAVIAISVDRFDQALGLELPELPLAELGEPLFDAGLRRLASFGLRIAG